MRSFLTWLETSRAEDGDTPAPLPAAFPERVREATPSPVVAAAAPTKDKMPAATPLAPVAVATPLVTPVAGPVPVARPVAPAITPALVPVAIVPTGKPFWHTLLRPNRRDLLFAAAGAGVLLVVELIVWLVSLILR
jgi:hypothetical protein